MTDPTRPAPLLTEDNHEFWDAAKQHRFVAQQCSSCHELRHPPRPMCPHCGSLDHQMAELSGMGTVYSYSLLHHPQHPAFTYPVVAAIIDLDEGLRFVSNVVDCDPHDVTVGMPVTVRFEPTANDGVVPVFRPAAATNQGSGQ